MSDLNAQAVKKYGNNFLKEVEEQAEMGEWVKMCMQCGVCAGSCPFGPHWEHSPQKLFMMIRAGKREEVLTGDDKRRIANHEAGHALVGALMPDYDPVQKISIIPRGNAGGLTFFTPSEERMESGLYSRAYLQNQMAVALGGSITGEHGVGSSRNAYLELQRGSAAVEAMRRIKAALDPLGILNPGKVLPG